VYADEEESTLTTELVPMLAVFEPCWTIRNEGLVFFVEELKLRG